MDIIDAEKSCSSDHENLDSSDSEANGSSHPGYLDSSDAEENSTASSVAEYLRFSGPAHRQNWSLPDSIIFYIAKNPSTPKLYQKLIETCKYFFLVNSIVICSDLGLGCREIDGDVENDDENGNEGAVAKDTHDYWQITQNLVIKNVCYERVDKKIDLKNYFAKLWIIESVASEYITLFSMHIHVTNKKLVSPIIPKIYRCNVKGLQIQRQNLSLTEFSLLATSALKVWLFKVTVKHDYGTVVPVEKIIDFATKATFFYIDLDDNDASISSETVKNLLQIPHLSSIEAFHLENIPGSFDIETLYDFIKKQKDTKFWLTFSDSVSSAYKKRLRPIRDKIIEYLNRGGYTYLVFNFFESDE